MPVAGCSWCCPRVPPPLALSCADGTQQRVGVSLSDQETHSPAVALCLAGDSIRCCFGCHLSVVFPCAAVRFASSDVTQPASNCRSACSSGRSSVRQRPSSAMQQQHCSNAVQIWRSAASGRSSSRVGLCRECSSWRLSSLQPRPGRRDSR